MRVVLLVAALVLLWGVSHTPELAFVFLLFIPIGIRDAMVRAWVGGEQLHVRNFWRRYDLERTDIESFSVGESLSGRGGRLRTVEANLRDGGTRRLSATRRRSGAHNQADDICTQLNAWLHAGA